MGDIQLAYQAIRKPAGLRGRMACRLAMRLTRIAVVVLAAVGAWAALIFGLTLLMRSLP